MNIDRPGREKTLLWPIGLMATFTLPGLPIITPDRARGQWRRSEEREQV